MWEAFKIWEGKTVNRNPKIDKQQYFLYFGFKESTYLELIP